ncbi:Ig-like domain-containing protein [Shewanella sp. GXUN23E]|uniref:Ig-like domain-containing protein n=1 Tax=Shewanella sp. GXUN23E TaxID=3422498 RepID=UPI003D7E101B
MLRRLSWFFLMVVLQFGCSDESEISQHAVQLALAPVVERNDNNPPRIELLVIRMQQGQQQTIDLTHQVTADVPWTINQITHVSGNITATLNNTSQIDITALSAGFGEIIYLLESGGEYYPGYLAVLISAAQNTPPEAADIRVTSDGTMPLTLDLGAYITDAEQDEIQIDSLLQTANRFTLNGTTVQYTPAGFVGIDVATYIASDGKGGWAAGLIEVTVTDASPAPVTLSTEPLIREMLVGQSLALDISPAVSASAPWMLESVSASNNLVDVSISGSNLILSAQAQGLTEVRYQVTAFQEGNTAVSAEGLLVVAVSVPDNQAPYANDVQLQTAHDSNLSISLDAYIGDDDGDVVAIDSLLQTASRFTLIGTSVQYSPAGFVGVDSATYIVSDGKGGWAAGLIEVTVTDASPAPVTLFTEPLIREMLVGQNLTLDISPAVSASAPWKLDSVSASNNLVDVSLSGSNLILNAQAAGVAEISYQVSAAGEQQSGLLVVAVSDTDNQQPFANNISASTDSDSAIQLSLATAYGDLDGDTVSVTGLLQGADRFSLSGDTLSYTPSGFIGVDTVTYLVVDGRGGLAAGLVVVNVADASPPVSNAAPTAANYSFATDSATTVLLDFAALSLVADTDGDSLALTVYGGDGRVSVSGLQLTYDPNGYVGADEFTYQVSDGKGGSALGHVSVTVSDAVPANQVPVAASTSLSLTLAQINASAQRIIDLSALVSDADGDTLTVTQVYAALGSVVISGALELTYTASASVAADNFSYVVSDGKGGYAQASISVSISNQAPTSQAISLAIDPYGGGNLTIDLAAYTADADGDTLSLADLGSATSPAQISSNGLVLTYAPNGFVGTEVIQYAVTDGLAVSSNTLKITSSSQAVLTANNLSAGPYAMDAGAQTIDLSTYVSNSSGRSMSIASVYGATLGSVTVQSGTLNLTYTPNDISYGTDIFYYQVEDGEGNTATAQITVTVGAPAAPAITSLTLDYAGALQARLVCDNCSHPSLTRYQFDVDGLPVSGIGDSYALVNDDKDKPLAVTATVMNKYCNADGSGVNGSNACRQSRARSVIQAVYVKQVYPSKYAFTALKSDGSAIAWGDANYGGDSSAVQSQLVDIVEITQSERAFAALKSDGTVVAWGSSLYGGDASSVQSDLVDVVKVYANQAAFAAVKADGSVVTWGWIGRGGNSSAVQAQLTNVSQIFSTDRAFAALKADGTVVTWGETGYGADSTAVSASLVNVKTISATLFAFAALKHDGTVVAWGDSSYGGDSSAVQASLTNVSFIHPNWRAFAAVKHDGTVVTWGWHAYGGDSSAVQALLTGVTSVSNTTHTFAARKSDGSVVTWGAATIGGDSSAVQSQLTGVEQIFASTFAYAALKSDGSLVTWGQTLYGGDSSAVQSELVNVTYVEGAELAMAAIVGDGDIVTWGYGPMGGDSSAVQSEFNKVTQLWNNMFCFVARNTDGTLITWGNASQGGDSSAVQGDFNYYTTLFTDLDY